MKKLLVLALLIASPALAQQMPAEPVAVAKHIYAKPTRDNIMKAMLRAQALDATNPGVQTDYLLLNECQIFRDNYRDDFRLQQIRKAVLETITLNRAGWPDAFMFVTPMKLDQYDFNQQIFAFRDEVRLKNVNSFKLMEGSRDVCMAGQTAPRVPTNASVRIDQPVTLPGIPLNQNQGKILLDHMKQAGNNDRQIYARFNIDLSYMPPYDNQEITERTYLFEGSLYSIEFFEDQALTKPIWTFTKG